MVALWAVTLISLTALLACIYRRQHRQQSDYELPQSIDSTYTIRGSHLRSSTILQLGRHTKVTGRIYLLRLETTLFNKYHEALSTTIRKRYLAGKILRRLYNAGSVSGVAGMCYAIGFMAWSVYQFGAETSANNDGRTTIDSSKEDASWTMAPTDSYDTSDSDLPRFLIPGWTVPLADLPTLFLSLLICQIVHEAGHAFAAAIDGIPLLSAGATLTAIFPSAFVSLPNNYATSHRDPMNASYMCLRISTSGAWHNLLFWFFLGLASWANTSKALGAWELGGYGGWKNVREEGVVVLSIANFSPLQSYIPLSSVVTSVDDITLGGGEGIQSWNRFFLGANRSVAMDGWCVSRPWYEVQPSECCQQIYGDTADFCFVPSSRGLDSADDESFGQGRCIDAVSLFTPTSALSSNGLAVSTSRCQTACVHTPILEGAKEIRDLEQGLGPKEICIRPKAGIELLRLNIAYPPWMSGADDKRSEVVVWNGPPLEVWEQLRIGFLQPRHWWIPANLPVSVEIFLRYLSTITFSLFCFNLLPLPFLDGSQVLSDVLDMMALVFLGFTDEQVDFIRLEAGEGFRNNHGTMRYHRYRIPLEKSIRSLTFALLILMCCLSLWKEVA